MSCSLILSAALVCRPVLVRSGLLALWDSDSRGFVLTVWHFLQRQLLLSDATVFPQEV